MNTKFAYTLALLCNHVLAMSPPVEVDGANGIRYSATTGEENQRVGNAVLVNVVGVMTDQKMTTLGSVLLACDGTWISHEMPKSAQSGIHGFVEMARHAKSQDVKIPILPIAFHKGEDGPNGYEKALLKRAAQLCKSAGPEPRNHLIPITSIPYDKQTGSATAIVTGTMVRRGATIDLWLRDSRYEITPIVLADGTTAEIAGESIEVPKATGKFSLNRFAFDCRNRRLGVFEVANYKAPGARAQSSAVSRDDVKFHSAIPGSYGEAQLEIVCRIYG